MKDSQSSRPAQSARGLKIAIIVSRFHQDVTDRLLAGALNALSEAKVSKRSLIVESVPGAFEIPLAAKKLAASVKPDAIVCLGAVIRGETEHFDYVASAVQQGVLNVSLETGIPLTFGVLTTESNRQALDRAGGSEGNKGYEAAKDAIEMAGLAKRYR